jgi:hypothetical protein
MAAPIEDHALSGDAHTAGPVSRDGAIDSEGPTPAWARQRE